MNENDEIEIDLSRVWEMIKKNFKFFAIVIVITTVLSGLYSVFFIAKTYTANSKLLIVQDYEQNQQISYSDVQLSQKLINTYTEILRSETISDEVIKNLHLGDKKIEHKDYLNMVTISSVKDTEIINVAVKTKDPNLSAKMANEIVSVFKKKISKIMNIENVTVLNSAKVPDKKSGPSNSKNAMMGFLLGCVIDGGILMYMVLTDRKIRTEEQLKEIFTDVPVIGLIPDFDPEGGKSK